MSDNTSKWAAIKDRIDNFRDKAIKWINWIAALTATVDFAGVLSSLPQIQPYIPANLYIKALAGAAIANFISHNFLKNRL